MAHRIIEGLNDAIAFAKGDETRGRKTVIKVQSWWCTSCSVEVYQHRCQHCGKSRREKK